MDQVKVYLALMGKHHFWVISGIVLVLSLISWFMASSRLQAEFTKNKTEIDGKLTAVKAVETKNGHPNADVTKELDKHTDKHGDSVFEAWKYRYGQQLKVPQWPRVHLGDEFVDFIERTDDEAEITPRLREVYQAYIQEEIQPLFKKINLRKQVEIEIPAAAAAARNLGAGAAAGPGQFEWRGLVAWTQADRDAIELRYDWQETPTSLQVRYANEDLWVYRALLDIIANTNKESDGALIKEHMLANIKQIEAVSIGQNVLPPVVFFVPPVSVAGEGSGEASGEASGEGATATGEGGVLGGLPPIGAGAPGVEGGEAGEGAVAVVNPKELISMQLKHGRYVNTEGIPLAYNAPAPFAEFKMMPFQMNLIMDQRKIPLLLVNCANSPLPVEVRQLSVLTGEEPLVAAARGGGEGGIMNRGGGRNIPGAFGEGREGRMPVRQPGGFNRGYSGEGGGGGFRGRAPREALGGNQGELGGEVELGPFDLQVEVRGVIYIFNKPDRSKVRASATAVPAEGVPIEPAASDFSPAAPPGPVPGTAPPAATTPPAATPPQAAPPPAAPPATVEPATTSPPNPNNK